MSKVIDSELSPSGITFKKIFHRIIYLYAFFLTCFLIFILSNLEIKSQPTPLEAENALEVHSSYSMLAGICINVGDCGNDQVILGLEKTPVSKQLYQFLVWKKQRTTEEGQ